VTRWVKGDGQSDSEYKIDTCTEVEQEAVHPLSNGDVAEDVGSPLTTQITLFYTNDYGDPARYVYA